MGLLCACWKIIHYSNDNIKESCIYTGLKCKWDPDHHPAISVSIEIWGGNVNNGVVPPQPLAEGWEFLYSQRITTLSHNNHPHQLFACICIKMSTPTNNTVTAADNLELAVNSIYRILQKNLINRMASLDFMRYAQLHCFLPAAVGCSKCWPPSLKICIPWAHHHPWCRYSFQNCSW